MRARVINVVGALSVVKEAPDPGAGAPRASLRDSISRLAREASIELNVQDLPVVDQSRRYLPSGATVYISHLPKQSFGVTLRACAAVKAAGFNPIPHLPVRLLEGPEMATQFISESVEAGAGELLLIAGDYAEAAGPYSSVMDVLRCIDLRARGVKRISIGGHPEGHPTVALDTIRGFELAKAALAAEIGLEVTFVTQFFFESIPFLRWAYMLRAAGVSARIRAGLAGPAKIATLLRFATRCGVGASIKALGNNPGVLLKLLGEHGPENLLTQLATAATSTGPQRFEAIHMFCFGGYLRTCRWLHGLAQGQFELSEALDLTVH